MEVPPHVGAANEGDPATIVDGGLASGQVLGTPTLFIDGIVHRGYDPPALLATLAP